MQTGHSQLGRYKARRQMVISEESEAEALKPKSQLVEFWLVREYCDMGSVSVSIHGSQIQSHSDTWQQCSVACH